MKKYNYENLRKKGTMENLGMVVTTEKEETPQLPRLKRFATIYFLKANNLIVIVF